MRLFFRVYWATGLPTHQTIDRAGAFLGVDDVDVDKTRIRKQNPEPLRQLILNYEEVQRALANTPFAAYLPG